MATQKLRFDDFDNNFSKTLSNTINGTDLTIYLSGVPAKATEGYLVLDADDLSKYEIIYFNTVGSNYVSCPATGGRGQGGTSARAHDAGAPVKMYFLGEHFKALRDAVFTGFFELNYVPVYDSASTITIPTDVSAIFTSGRKLKITFASSGVKYFVVKSSAYAGGNTTVTLVFETVLNEVISKIEMDVNPQAFSQDLMPETPYPVYANGMARQAIMNGNFDIWQRGTSIVTPDASGTFLADRWQDALNKNGGTLPTLTRSRQLLTPGDIPGATYFSRLTTNGSGSSLGVSAYHTYTEKIENGTSKLCGLNKKVTVSFYARSDIANKRICPVLAQNYGTGGSPSAQENIKGTPITLTSTWTKYTATFTTNTLVGKTFGTNGDDYLELDIWKMWGTTTGNTYVQTGVTAETYGGAGNIDIAQVQLCAGDVALPFQPKSREEELISCQRYTRYAYRPTGFGVGSTTSAGITLPVVGLRETGTPTVTLQNTANIIFGDGSVRTMNSPQTMSGMTFILNTISGTFTTTNVAGGGYQPAHSEGQFLIENEL